MREIPGSSGAVHDILIESGVDFTRLISRGADGKSKSNHKLYLELLLPRYKPEKDPKIVSKCDHDH